MKIINVFNDDGKTLQQIMEQFLIEYCLQTNKFKNN